jgi:hypothetical protein
MIPLAALFRGGFLIVILLWYSVSVWHAMDGYFRDEFKKYLEREYKQNVHLKADMVIKTDSQGAKTATSIHGTGVKEGSGNTATSIAKTEHGDRVKENNNDVKQYIQDISIYNVPKLETKSPFMSANTKPHTSTVQHLHTHLKDKETQCTLTPEIPSSESKCD